MRLPWKGTETDLKRELAHHLHELTAEYERRGHSHEEAMWMAKREFGGSEQVKERCRDERRWAGIPAIWMSGIRQDVAFALRQMRSRACGLPSALPVRRALHIDPGTLLREQ